MDSGQFDFRTLGTPDYAQAHAMVASLPRGIRCVLDGVDKELMARLLHLSWKCSTRSGRGAAYCWPTLRTLGLWCRRSTRTIDRHLKKLASLGLVVWKRRSTCGGGWTSNLYRMGKTFLATLFARQGKKVKQFRDMTPVAHNDLKREYKLPPSTGKASLLSEFMQTIRGNDPVRDSVPPDRAARTREMSAEEIAERKALLKRQAEMLKARGL